MLGIVLARFASDCLLCFVQASWPLNCTSLTTQAPHAPPAHATRSLLRPPLALVLWTSPPPLMQALTQPILRHSLRRPRPQPWPEPWCEGRRPSSNPVITSLPTWPCPPTTRTSLPYPFLCLNGCEMPSRCHAKNHRGSGSLAGRNTEQSAASCQEEHDEQSALSSCG